MEIKNYKLYAILFIALLLIGCSDNKCDFIIDSIQFSSQTEADRKTYFLYLRTTGWQEKVVYFELYDHKPLFDECSKTESTAIYAVDYDYYPNDDTSEKKYVKDIFLQLDSREKLRIVYTKNKGEGFDNVYDVKFTQ